MNADAPKPVYVLYGNDAFLQDLHRREIVAELIGDSDPQTCVSVLDATASAAEVFDELRTLPFLASRRVVIVRDADAFIAANRELLEKFLEAPPATASLILIVSSWPSNTRVYKLVAKVGVAVECSLGERESPVRWIIEAADRRGKKIDRDAAELLAEWVGRDLALLDGEVEKLALYAHQRKSITSQDVGALVTAVAGPGAFDLTNAITDGNAAAALEALGGMLTVRGEEFKVLGMIGWHLRRALKGKQLQESGRPPETILGRMPEGPKRAFVAYLRRRPLRALQQDFRRLISADLAMKSGADASAAMQELVVGLCS